MFCWIVFAAAGVATAAAAAPAAPPPFTVTPLCPARQCGTNITIAKVDTPAPGMGSVVATVPAAGFHIELPGGT
jgi:hypothetical protein